VVQNKLGVISMERVKGKVALVSGGAMGIGRACALTLAREGASVVVTDIEDAAGQAVVSEINAQGGNSLFIHHDVTDEPAWESVVNQVVESYDRIDVLVNNAGIAIAVPSIADMSLADFQKQNAINLDGVFLGMKHCIPVMTRNGGGSIINMSSVAGLKSSAGLAAYGMTKGGVRLLSRSVAVECANAGNGIRVNSVHPGIIETAIWDKMGLGGEPGANTVDMDNLATTIVPGAKLGTPQDIANGVLHLASDDSSYMTGMEFVISWIDCLNQSVSTPGQLIGKHGKSA
jgi:NAD(P)-dependent dehydrogenase (short-subunit alcohol dehydrogenase family)